MKNLFKKFRKQAPKVQAPKENVLIQLNEREERLPKYWGNFDRSLFLRYKQAQIS